MTSNPSPGRLIFDLDGTLVDSVPDLAGALDSLMFEKALAPIGEGEARRLIGHGISNLVRSALTLRGLDLEAYDASGDIKRFTEIYAGRLSYKTRPYPGVKMALADLAAAGWKMAVCTNKVERFARHILADLELDHFFAVIAGPDTFGVGKPDPEHLLRTAAAMAPPADGPVIFIGDSGVDIDTAKAACIPVVAMSYGYSKVPVAELSPDAVIDNMMDLQRVIAGFKVPAS